MIGREEQESRPKSRARRVRNRWFSGCCACALFFFGANGHADTLYVSLGGNVARISPRGALTTVASTLSGSPGDVVTGLAFDKNGNLFYSDYYEGIEKISPQGTVSSFVNVDIPEGLAFDTNGNLYVSHFGTSYWPDVNTVSKITPGGSVSFFAGGFSGASSLAFDKVGNLFVANYVGGWISKVAPSGDVSTFASGFVSPLYLALDANDVLYVSDAYAGKVFRVRADGTRDVFVDLGRNRTGGIAFNHAGDLFVDSYDTGAIYRVSPSGTPTIFATGINYPWFFAFGGPIPDPYLDVLPTDQTAEMGSDVEFGASAVGASRLSYQWFFNGANPIADATNSVLRLHRVQQSPLGSYTVVATDADGSVTSSPVVLSIIPPVPRRMVPGLFLDANPPNLLNVQRTASLQPPLWTNVGSVVLTNYPLGQYFDVAAPAGSQGFYRVRQTNSTSWSPQLGLAMIPALTLTGTNNEFIGIDYINRYGPTNAWTILDTETLTNSPQFYFDVTAQGQPPRLYRVATSATAYRPAAICWTNPGGGNWSYARNWTPNMVPGARDNAFITNSGTYQVYLDTSVHVATITVGGPSAMATLLNRNNYLTIGAWAAVATNGQVQIGNPVAISNCGLNLGGPISVDGSLYLWSVGGYINGPGQIQIGPSGNLYVGGADVACPIVSAGYIAVGGSGPVNTVTNLATGLIEFFDPIGPGPFNPFGGSAIANLGTIRIVTGSQVRLNLALFNSGSFEVVSNVSVSLLQSGVHTASFLVGPRAWLSFGGVGSTPITNTFTADSHITGSGSLMFSYNAAVKFDGELDLDGEAEVLGTVTFSGTNRLRASPLAIQGGSTFTGTAIFSSGATVSLHDFFFSGGILTGSDPITVTGNGLLVGGTVSNFSSLTFAGQTTIQSPGLSAYSGVINNAGTATASGVVSLQAGSSFNNLSGATYTMTGGGLQILSGGSIFNNAGAFIWSGGYLFTGNNSLISNALGGTFDINIDSQEFGWGGSSFINLGLLRKIGGSGTNMINDEFINYGTLEARSGVLAFGSNFTQMAGHTLLNGGNIASQFPLQFNGGSLTGTGVISGSVIGSATCLPGPGSGFLRVEGDYTQRSTGALDIGLGGLTPGSNFAPLMVTGTFNISGILQVAPINGFVPAPGDQFRVLTFSSRTGDFVSFLDQTGANLTRLYDGTGLNLVAPGP
jgi:sugar lactone lactonase YvrE